MTKQFWRIFLYLYQKENRSISWSIGFRKSTIANLLTRFYEVNQGEILIDSHNIKDVTLKSLRG